jgi:hypothetical protein
MLILFEAPGEKCRSSYSRLGACFAALQTRNILFFSKHSWLRPQAALRSQQHAAGVLT